MDCNRLSVKQLRNILSDNNVQNRSKLKTKDQMCEYILSHGLLSINPDITHTIKEINEEDIIPKIAEKIDINYLPDELILNIILSMVNDMDLVSLSNFCLTSKRFNEICKDRRVLESLSTSIGNYLSFDSDFRIKSIKSYINDSLEYLLKDTNLVIDDFNTIRIRTLKDVKYLKEVKDKREKIMVFNRINKLKIIYQFRKVKLFDRLKSVGFDPIFKYGDDVTSEIFILGAFVLPLPEAFEYALLWQDNAFTPGFLGLPEKYTEYLEAVKSNYIPRDPERMLVSIYKITKVKPGPDYVNRKIIYSLYYNYIDPMYIKNRVIDLLPYFTEYLAETLEEERLHESDSDNPINKDRYNEFINEYSEKVSRLK